MNNLNKTKLLKSVTEAIDNFFKDEPAEFDWRNIINFDQVCDIARKNYRDYVIPDNADSLERGTILFSMLQLVCHVFKNGVVLDYSNPKQKKYRPWGEYNAGSGFSLHGVAYAYTYTLVGPRLEVDDEEKARHIWKYFNYIYQDYWQEK